MTWTFDLMPQQLPPPTLYPGKMKRFLRYMRLKLRQWRTDRERIPG